MLSFALSQSRSLPTLTPLQSKAKGTTTAQTLLRAVHSSDCSTYLWDCCQVAAKGYNAVGLPSRHHLYVWTLKNEKKRCLCYLPFLYGNSSPNQLSDNDIVGQRRAGLPFHTHPMLPLLLPSLLAHSRTFKHDASAQWRHISSGLKSICENVTFFLCFPPKLLCSFLHVHSLCCLPNCLLLFTSHVTVTFAHMPYSLFGKVPSVCTKAEGHLASWCALSPTGYN